MRSTFLHRANSIMKGFLENGEELVVLLAANRFPA